MLLAADENISARGRAPDIAYVGRPAPRVEQIIEWKPTGTLAERTEAFEKEVMLAEIRRHNFHMTNVARALGLERSHLYKKCQQLGIDLQSLRHPE